MAKVFGNWAPCVQLAKNGTLKIPDGTVIEQIVRKPVTLYQSRPGSIFSSPDRKPRGSKRQRA